MAIRRVDIVGSYLPILTEVGEDRENADYRPVPESDRGNADYTDRGYAGWYAPSNREPYRAPENVRWFTGYGASEEDLQRGYHVPDVDRRPEFEKQNYEMRSTQPKDPFESFGNTDVVPADLEFRSRNQRARGFLTRPRIPTER